VLDLPCHGAGDRELLKASPGGGQWQSPAADAARAAFVILQRSD